MFHHGSGNAALSHSARELPGSTRSRLAIRAAGLLVVLGAVLAVYLPSHSAGALYMDDTYYLGAPELRQPGWSSVKTIFSEVLAPTIVKGYYQPLALISTMVDFLDPAAATNLQPFHRTSLLLHLLNVALVVILLFLLFRNWMAGCLLGLLYGLHPLQVDSVLWVAERKELLSTFFALWTLVLYVAYARHAAQTQKRDRKRYGAALLMYLCAVLSKPTAVPVMALLFVLDYWPLNRLSRKNVAEKIPFFIVCILSSIVTIISQTRTLSEGRVETMHLLYLPFVMAFSVGLYLWKTIWPSGLVYDYLLPHPFSATNPEVALCMAGAVAVFAAITVAARRQRGWLAGGLFFFLAILPALGIVRFTSSVVSNRFMYLPMVGLLLPLCWAVSRLWSATGQKTKTLGVRAAIICAGLLLAIGCAGATRNYESKWHDTLTLLQYYEKLSPDDWKLHTRLGNEWVQQGNYREAVDEFKIAGRLNPGWAENHLNLGRALFTIDRIPEAREAFAAALQLTPNDWRCHMLMGLTLARLNDPDEALKEFETARRISPMMAEIHYSIAGILAHKGQVGDAVREYQETLRLDPDFIAAKEALDTIAVSREVTNRSAALPVPPDLLSR